MVDALTNDVGTLPRFKTFFSLIWFAARIRAFGAVETMAAKIYYYQIYSLIISLLIRKKIYLLIFFFVSVYFFSGKKIEQKIFFLYFL